MAIRRQRKRNRMKRKIKHVPIPVELIHRIQSLLPVKEAARTCILSKSWLHAWSTLPNLRYLYQIQKKSMEDTLLRYHQHHIPLETFHLQYDIPNNNDNGYLASHAEEWIRHVASKTYLKELTLSIFVGIDSFTLPDELFSSRNLNTLHVTAQKLTLTNSLWICSTSVISCVSLRVLKLEHLNISENLLNNILSSCVLLEKINLCCCEGFNTIKVKNLVRLQELEIVYIEEGNDFLEIDNLPSLGLLHYNSMLTFKDKPLPFNLDSLGTNLKHLYISGVIMDNTFFDIIKSRFPLLESLTLGIVYGGMETFVITSLSIKTLDIRLLVNRSFHAQVYAPNLLYCVYHGDASIQHSLSFPNTPPAQLKLTMNCS